jgi:hypothetical protein
MNGLWEQTYRLGNNMSALINAQTPEAVVAAASMPTEDCQKHLSSLRNVLPANYMKYHADYANALGTINTALTNNREVAVEFASDIQKAYELDQKVLQATLDLSNEVSAQMSAYADETENSGTSLLKGGIAMTVGGVALGALLLFLIIYSLNNVFKRSSAYARAVASGNFDGEPGIEEKGDVGGDGFLHQGDSANTKAGAQPVQFAGAADRAGAIARSWGSGRFPGGVFNPCQRD